MKVRATTVATRILQLASLAILSLALTPGAASAADPAERTEGKAASSPSREPEKSDDGLVSKDEPSRMNVSPGRSVKREKTSDGMPDPRAWQPVTPASPSK